MPTATWNSGASTDMNNTANYSAVWDATYDLVWNNTSVVNCAATGGITCNSITIASNYTGTWSISGQTATLTLGFSDDGTTGAHNYGNGITCNGASSTFHVGSGVGVITATSCALTMNGTTAMVLDDDKGVVFLGLTVGANGVISNSGSATTIYLGPSPLTFINGGSLTWTTRFTMRLTATGNFITITAGIPAFAQNSGSALRFEFNSTGLTGTIPAMTVTSTNPASSFLLIDSYTVACTFSLGGNLNIGSSCKLSFNATGAVGGSTLTLNTNNYNITCSDFSCGSSAATSSVILNMGSGSHSCTTFGASHTITGACTFNMQSSIISCTGAWTFGSNHTVTPGTSIVNFTGTAAQSVTSNGKSFYDVNVNRATAGTFTFADAPSLHDFVVNAANTQAITWTGFTMSASGNVTLNGSSTVNCGNGITLTGNSKTLAFNATLGVVTATSCVLTANGTGDVLDDDKSVTMKSVTLGAGAGLTSSGAATTTFSDSATPVTTGANSTLTVSSAWIIISTASITVFSWGAGTTFNGTGAITLAPGANTLTLTIPATTYTGSGLWTMYEGAGAYTPTIYSLSGALNLGTANLSCYTNAALKNVTLSTGGNSVTCGDLKIGSGNTGTFTFQPGASVFVVTSYTGSTYNSALGTSTIGMATSTWTCSGSWVHGSNHTVTQGTSLVTITGTSTVTPNGKAFYSLTVNSVANTVTLGGALTATGNLIVTTGSLTSGNNAINVTANISFSGAGTINLGTSTVTNTGNSTITFNAGPTYTTAASIWVVQANTTIITGANVTVSRLRTITAGQTITWNTGVRVFTIANYVLGDIQGAAGNQVAWESNVPGTQYNVSIVGGAVLQFVDFMDCDFSGGGAVTANDGTSITRGGNANFLTFNVVTVAPIVGPATGGTLLTFTDTGNGCGGACVVTVGGNPAGAETVVTPQSLTAVTPAGAAGVVNIVITNGDGDVRTLLGAYTYEAVNRRPGEARCYVSSAIGI